MRATIEAADASETSVTYQTKRRHNPEDNQLSRKFIISSVTHQVILVLEMTSEEPVAVLTSPHCRCSICKSSEDSF
jgi:hypothetical protein